MQPESVYHRLQHDAAFACARALLAIVAPCLRPEEHRDAFEEFYTALRAMLERYEREVQKEGRRLFPLRPSRN